jgi:hypothetical protein
MDDFAQRLNLLGERNADLERRCEILRGLSKNLDDHIQKIQVMYEAMPASQENQCIDMVAFDEEIRTLTRELFPLQAKQTQPRPREENRDLLMQEFIGLQRLDPAACEERLHAIDPLLKQVTEEARRMIAFIRKYSTFLGF